MLVEQNHNLDKSIAKRKLDGRIETSAPLSQIIAPLGKTARADVAQFEREGLGRWEAVSIEFDNFGEILVAAPMDLPGAGCSLWFKTGPLLDDVRVASIIRHIVASATVHFITPEGEQIIPKPISAFVGNPSSRTSGSSIRTEASAAWKSTDGSV